MSWWTKYCKEANVILDFQAARIPCGRTSSSNGSSFLPYVCCWCFLKQFHPVAKKHHSHLFRKCGFTYWTNIAGTMGFRGLNDYHWMEKWEEGDNLLDFMKYTHICPAKPKGQLMETKWFSSQKKGQGRSSRHSRWTLLSFICTF